ncbi:hypothetical protein ACWEO2_26165 [Nocardia sp. NPDC004278]
MTSQNTVTAVLVLAILGWIIYRQNQWRLFDPVRMWRLPVILGLIGVIGACTSTDLGALRTLDIALLVFEGVLSLAIGAVMGVMSRFRRDEVGALLVRTGAAASALWLVSIAVRVGVDVIAVGYGATSSTSSGLILLLLGLNRAGRIAVISARAEKSTVAPPMSRAH